MIVEVGGVKASRPRLSVCPMLRLTIAERVPNWEKAIAKDSTENARTPHDSLDLLRSRAS